MRRFYLRRNVDLSGISGTGVVAEGVEFHDKTVAIRWYGKYPSTVLWNSISDVQFINGHNGMTEVVWSDPEEWTSPIYRPRGVASVAA